VRLYEFNGTFGNAFRGCSVSGPAAEVEAANLAAGL